MIELLDGPCKGMFSCARAPLYLRAVVNTQGKADVLDLVEDKPADDEVIYIYKRKGAFSNIHLNFGGGRGRFEALAEYNFLPGVNCENARDNANWQRWTYARYKSEGLTPP